MVPTQLRQHSVELDGNLWLDDLCNNLNMKNM